MKSLIKDNINVRYNLFLCVLEIIEFQIGKSWSV